MRSTSSDIARTCALHTRSALNDEDSRKGRLTHLSGPLLLIQVLLKKLTHFTICLVYFAGAGVRRRHERILQFALLLAFRSPRYVIKDVSASKALSIGATSLSQPSSLSTEMVFAVSSASGKEDGAAQGQFKACTWELVSYRNPRDLSALSGSTPEILSTFGRPQARNHPCQNQPPGVCPAPTRVSKRKNLKNNRPG